MNLFKKATASVALVSLVSGVFSTGVAAMNLAEIEAATSLANKGVINKVDTVADFRLDATITRAEAAKVAAEIAGIEPNSSCEGKFSDVSATTPNTWVCGYVEALLEAGKLSANENYNPERNLSKTESLKMMLEAAGDEVVYDNATWQADFVAHAVANAYISTFTDYNTAATRGFVFVAADAAHEANSDDNILDDILNEIEGGDDDTTTDNGDDNETPVVIGDDELTVTLSPETPDAAFVAAGRDRTEVLAFEVMAGSEDVTLKELTLEYTGLSNEENFSVISVYMGNKKVTKGTSKSFSEGEVDLTFENDTVIKAGETKTLVVNANIASATGTVSHKVTVSNLEASVDVVMDGKVSSNSFGVVDATNVATIEVDVDTLSDDVTVGEVEKLADFTIEEQDNEDVVVKSITIEFDNFDAEDDLRDLVLYADGEEVDVELFVNSDDEVIADIDVVIPQDESVDFLLKGVVVGSIGEKVEAEITDVYAVGVDSNLVASVDYDNNVIVSNDQRDIEGSEINVSFDKSDIDEAKPSAEDVLVGTLNLQSVSDYTIESLTVTAVSTQDSVNSIIKKLELDGSSSDKEVYSTGSFAGDTGVYTFEDISLRAGEEKNLDLTFEVNEATALNGADVTFTVAIVKVTDEENDEDYEGNTELGKILSTNSLDSKTVDIESASLTINQTRVKGKEVVLGNGVEVVLYKGKLNVGDSDEVTINDIEFTTTGSAMPTAYNVEDIIDSAELNIGGKTFDAEVKAGALEFSSMDAVIAAGSDNVEITLTATLKDTDDVNASDTVYVTALTVDAEDSENEDLNNLKITYATSTTEVVLNETGTIEMKVVQNGDNKDEIEEVVLAGTSNVALAEVEIEADQEDIKVQELTFIAENADLSTTLSNVRLMDGSKVIAEGAIVTYVQNESDVLSGATFTGTTIVFEDDFIIENTGNEIDAVLVADLEVISTEGGVVSAEAQDVVLKLASVEAKGANSNDDVFANGDTDMYVTDNTVSETVAIVPAIVTVASSDNFAEGDITAELEITLDEGNNDLDGADVYASGITFNNHAGLISEIINLDNNDAVLYSTGTAGSNGSLTDQTITFEVSESEIKDGDRLEIRLNDSTLSDGDTALIEVVRGTNGGFIYSIDSDDYNASNDSRVSLGTYKK